MPARPLEFDPGGPFPAEVRARILETLGSKEPRLLVLRSPDRAVGSAILARLAKDWPGAAIVVTAPPTGAGRTPMVGGGTQAEVAWSALPSGGEAVSLLETATAMRLVHTVLGGSPRSHELEALWLPPAVLEAYSRLPLEPTPTLAIDSWDVLVRAYLRDPPADLTGVPSEGELDAILVESHRQRLSVHLFVVTGRAHPLLDAQADVLLEASPATDGPAGRRSVLVLHPSRSGRGVPP
jgi:hypothetical protein